MTNYDEQIDVQDERSQIDTVEAIDIGTLRKAAKQLGITAQRDWTKEDFVKAIKLKQEANLASLVFDGTQAPKPGYARVLIHRDPSPGHRNTPVHVSVNGRIIGVPRGLEVDIPIPFVEALKNARSLVTSQNSDGGNGTVTSETERASYPFQVLGMTPGPFINQHDNRSANYERRYAFFKKIGRWPTDGELKEAMKRKIAVDLG